MWVSFCVNDDNYASELHVHMYIVLWKNGKFYLFIIVILIFVIINVFLEL